MNSLTPIEDYPPELRDVTLWAKELLGCASARLSCFEHGNPKLFLIIGTERTTQQDMAEHGTVWRDETGAERHWSYLQEYSVAQGNTPEELRAAVIEYKRLTGLTVEQYLRELAERKISIPAHRAPIFRADAA